MSGVRASTNLSPTACEAIEALAVLGDGATWMDIALQMTDRNDAAITRGINTACRAGRMHWRPITMPQQGEHRRLYSGPRSASGGFISNLKEVQ